jgi:hypothetical protein
MSKQLRSIDDYVACEVCGRTMLKGEHPEPYLAPSRERKLVCQLCASRAQQEGWIRESANPATPAQPPRSQESKRRFRRGRRAAKALVGSGAPDPAAAHSDSSSNGGTDPGRSDVQERIEHPAERAPIARIRRDPRHVRAVPTNAQLKIERAVALFNSSEHPRTVAGIARTLGSPQVCASTSADSAAEVRLTVAWEISWYQFVVDLSDTNEPVQVGARGQELHELEPEAQDWNASASPDGSLVLDAPKGSNGAEGDEGL